MSQNIKIVIDRSQLDDLKSEAKDALDDTKQAKVGVNNFLNNEGEEIKGAEQAGKRIARMYVPGAREVLAAQRAANLLAAGNVMGIVSIVFLAYRLYNDLKKMVEEQRREMVRYRQDVMRTRGYSSDFEYGQWEQEQQQGLADARNRPLVR